MVQTDSTPGQGIDVAVYIKFSAVGTRGVFEKQRLSQAF
jgi:hypothetical protein